MQLWPIQKYNKDIIIRANKKLLPCLLRINKYSQWTTQGQFWSPFFCATHILTIQKQRTTRNNERQIIMVFLQIIPVWSINTFVMTTIQLNFFKLNFFSLEPVEKHEAENNHEAILEDRITMNSTRRTPRSKHLNKYIIFLCLYNIFQSIVVTLI